MLKMKINIGKFMFFHNLSCMSSKYVGKIPKHFSNLSRFGIIWGQCYKTNTAVI